MSPQLHVEAVMMRRRPHIHKGRRMTQGWPIAGGALMVWCPAWRTCLRYSRYHISIEGPGRDDSQLSHAFLTLHMHRSPFI